MECGIRCAQIPTWCAMIEGNQSASPPADLRDVLAAERTALAWIRTGLALMGFGFVVARFGLFLQQVQALRHGASHGLSLWFGTGLIAAGVVVELVSGYSHARLVRKLDPQLALRPAATRLAVATGVFLALVGVAMAIYLIAVGGDQTSPVLAGETLMNPNLDSGIVTTESSHPFDETVARLERALEAKGVTLFATVDHSGEAAKVGMKLAPTKLLIFGSPKAGTPVMQAAPSSALDLPLKILIAQDAAGKVWISYNSPVYLGARHGIPPALVQNLAGVEALATVIK
jgi:uncharacterized protein (DUF302 family)/uncharacterized membrane protein YidH (DUF202 family)